MFPICEIHLWNRSQAKANELKSELEGMTGSFANKNLKVFTHESVRDSVKTADIIVTATHVPSPILFEDMVKDNVHINGMIPSVAIVTHIVNLIFFLTAVGANQNHHSEIDLKLYQSSKLYVDSWTGAKNELKSLDCPVEAEIGELINKRKVVTKHPRTIFHSLGMAVTDAAVAQIVETLYHKNN